MVLVWEYWLKKIWDNLNVKKSVNKKYVILNFHMTGVEKESYRQNSKEALKINA